MQIQKLVLNFFTFLSPLLIFGQEDLIYIGKVISEKDSLPLAYVNIGVVGTSLGTISDANGDFVLYLKEGINEEQIVRFSYLGFASKEYTIASLKLINGKNIQLASTSIHLQTVEVRPNLLTKKVVGHQKTNTRMQTNFAISKKPGQNLGAAIGRRFKLGKKTSQLDQFRFFVEGNNFDTIRFRINIYTIKNARPHQLINTQNIISTLINHQSGWVNIDLQHYQLFVNHDVIIAVEWIEHSQKGKVLRLPIAMPAIGTHFYKYGSQDKWKRFRGMSTAMVLTVKQ